MLSYVDDEEAREVISNIINYGDYPREFRWLFRKLAKEKSHKACYEAIKKELTDRLPEIKSQEDKKRFFRKFDLESVFYPDYFAGSKVNEVKRNLDKLCKLYRDDMKITDVCKCLIDSIASSASDIANEAGLWSEEAKQDLEEQDELILEHELDEDNLYRHVTIPVLSPNLVITQSGIPFTDFYKLRVLDLWVPSDSEILVKREALVKKFPELDLEPNENRQCW
jgi:hypothetical protein